MDGQIAERGAEFIDGSHSQVLSLADQLGLQLTSREHALDPQATLVDAAGRRRPTTCNVPLADDWARWEAALAELRPTDEFESGNLQSLIDGLGASAISRTW